MAAQDRPALTIEVTEASLEKGAVLLSTYDRDEHHPKDVVRSILQAMRADPQCRGKTVRNRRPAVATCEAVSSL